LGTDGSEPPPSPLKKPISALAWLIGNAFDGILYTFDKLSEDDIGLGPQTVAFATANEGKYVLKITVAAINKKHHNWFKIFKNEIPTLDDITEIAQKAIVNGLENWQTERQVLNAGTKTYVGEGLILRGEVQGETIWVKAVKSETGTITVTNVGVD
jgi:hypothetical protein